MLSTSLERETTCIHNVVTRSIFLCTPLFALHKIPMWLQTGWLKGDNKLFLTLVCYVYVNLLIYAKILNGLIFDGAYES